MFEGVNGAMQLAIIDMTLVFLILGGLALVMAFLKNMVGVKSTKNITKKTEVISQIVKSSYKEEKEKVEDKLVAVITAAVAAHLEKPKSEFKILSIKKYSPLIISPWVAAGRQELMLGKDIKY